MSPVFLDTVGLIALWDVRDQSHTSADRVYRELLSQWRRFVTTNLVLVECGNSAARRPYRARVLPLRNLMAESGDLIDPTSIEAEAAWTAYHRGEAAQAGIVDQFSFVIMRRLRITEAFTCDAHFRAAGLETLF